MAGPSFSKISIGSMLIPLPPKHQVVVIDRLLADSKLDIRALLPLQRLRSVLMVDLIDEYQAKRTPAPLRADT